MPPQIGLHLPRQNLERRTLADAIGAHESQHLTGPWHGEPVQLEAVGPIAVRGVLLQVLGQVDDVDGLEGTLFDADAAADAEGFGEVGDLGFGAHFDAELAQFDDGAGLFAFLFAFFGFAFLGVDDGDAGQAVGAGG